MTLVVDSSFVFAAFADKSPQGAWASSQLRLDSVEAPHILAAEVASIFRRDVLAGSISNDSASLMLADVLALPVRLRAFEPFADRVWQLRSNLTPYDAWYVALAEALDAPLATLDQRLIRAPGPRCEFLTYQP